MKVLFCGPICYAGCKRRMCQHHVTIEREKSGEIAWHHCKEDEYIFGLGPCNLKFNFVVLLNTIFLLSICAGVFATVPLILMFLDVVPKEAEYTKIGSTF